MPLPIEPTQIDQLLKKHYGYQGDHLAQRMPDSFNINYRIGGDFFVKATPRGQLQPQGPYAAKIALVRMMHQRGLPVPEVIQTRDGKDFVSEGEFDIEVHRWMPEVELYGGHPGQLEQVARFMAKFQTCIDEIKAPEVEVLRALPSPYVGITEQGREPFLDELAGYERELARIPEPLRSHVRETIPILRERYQQRLQRSTHDVGLNHADLHDLQMLFHTGSKDLAVIIDWEGSCVDTRTLDIGYTLERLSMDSKRLYSDQSCPLSEFTYDPRKVAVFLEQYGKERPLTNNHLTEMVDQLTLLFMNSNARMLRRVFGPEQNYKLLTGLRIRSIQRIESLRQHLPILK